MKEATSQTLISVVRRTGSILVDELIARLHGAGYTEISAAHHTLFENIDPDGTRLTLLAARAGVTHQSMSELVGSLERRGYVSRRRDPTDGRARLVRLTPMGVKLVRRARREIMRIEREWDETWRRAGGDGDLASVLAKALVERGYRPSE
jgi:DNA-binding MarR family transcriptional regulator